MGKTSGGGTTTTVQNSSPWSGVQPNLRTLYDYGQEAFQRPMSFFPGQTYANPAQETSHAIDWQSDRALRGSPINDAMSGELTKTLGGDYLDANPAMAEFTQHAGSTPEASLEAQNYLRGTANGSMLNANPYVDAMFDKASNAVTQGVNSTFGGAGRWGSGAHANALTSGLSDMATDIYGGNYAQERQNQLAAASGLGSMAQGDKNQRMQALSGLAGIYGDERTRQMQGMLFAPQAANQDYYDIAKYAEAGAQREGLGQQAIDDQMARFNYAQSEPWQRLQQYSGILNGGLNFGTTTGTGTQTQPRGSLGAGLLGGAATGAGIGSMFGPIGMGIGAGAGGLLGLFGR
jgi:hypothetical protein